MSTEPTVNFTLEYINEKGCWEEFCDWKGWQYWIMNEGQASSDEIIAIPLSIAKKLGLI